MRFSLKEYGLRSALIVGATFSLSGTPQSDTRFTWDNVPIKQAPSDPHRCTKLPFSTQELEPDIEIGAFHCNGGVRRFTLANFETGQASGSLYDDDPTVRGHSFAFDVPGGAGKNFELNYDPIKEQFNKIRRNPGIKP